MNRTLTRSWLHAAVAALLTAFATLARADGPGPLELAVGAGYSRGYGRAAGEMMPKLQDLSGNGGALRVEAGWRIDPRWLVGTYVETARFASGEMETHGMTGVAAGVQGQLHVSPRSDLDPWVGVGFGWRGLWLEHAAGTHVMQGLDLARLQVGIDYRVSPRFSLAPTIGIAWTEMLSEKRPGASGYTDIEDRKAGVFLFTGVSGRIDVLGGGASDGR